MRTASAAFDDIPGQLPTAQVPADVDADEVAESTVRTLNRLEEHDLAPIAIWRDLLSLTDTFRTFYSGRSVYETLSKRLRDKRGTPFRRAAGEPKRIEVPGSSWIDVGIEFNTDEDGLVGACSGVVSVLVDEDGGRKIWMLRTWLERYEGHGDPDRLTGDGRSAGHVDGHGPPPSVDGGHRKVYEAIIVGGGHSGLGVAGRMHALGIDYVLFDNRPQIGDSWAHRYDSLKFHTIREYSNLPFGRTWEHDDPREVPKDRIASGYKQWSQRLGINAYEDTEVESARWDADSRVWAVKTRRASSHDQEKDEWRAKNLIVSIGTGHKYPLSPDWATPSRLKDSGYKGTIIHGADYRNASAFAGKSGIVVGTANTAHDVAEDMADAGMRVIMCQRSPTFVFPHEWLVAGQQRDYRVDKPTDVADRELVTVPTKIAREQLNRTVHHLINENPGLFDGLENAGFKVDRYGDLFTNIYMRAGGHYVEIGASKRIIQGEIRVTTVPIQGLTEKGLAFQDGSELHADLIVLATGFNHDFRQDAAELVGRDVADQMDDFWRPDGEGEIRGYARLAGHPALYYHGAECRLARFMSRFVALQVQKELLGQPLRPYLDGRPGMQQ